MSVNHKVVDQIKQHIGLDNKSKWYVGIATNPRNRLFLDHRVQENGGHWIYCDASSEREARDTEQYLLELYPFKGNIGGGDHPRYVYAYQITSTTVE